MIICMGSKEQAGVQNGILEKYYNKQKYSNNDAGLFMKESEKIITAKLSPIFNNSSDIVIIKEFCDPYNLSGCITSLTSGQIEYFSREGKNKLINFGTTSYSIAPIFYERILKLVRNDSLQYNKEINDKQSDANDESCWLYIISLARIKGRYAEKKITILHPLAFRRSILGY